jgi:hypothetical protein
MDNIRRTTIRNLVIFSTVVFSIGWVGRYLDVLMGNPASESLGMLLWLVVPTGTALLLRAFAGDGWADFGIKLNIKEGAVWYLVALLVYPVLTVLALVIGGGLSLITFPGLSFSTIGLILHTFALGALPQFVKNIFEETAWRGYLAPKVYSLGLNDFVGHLLVGLVWGAWHIPYYLFFVDRALLQDFTTLTVAAFIPVSIVVMIAWAIVYGEIRLLSGSVWPAVLMHMVEDTFLNQLITEQRISIVPGTDWLVSPVNGLISIFLFAAVGVGLNRYRRARRQVQPA